MTLPVEVVQLAPERVDYALRAVGSLDAFEQVQVTSRVTGAVERVNFKEGQRVARGAVLAEIEPERFRLAEAQAKAALDRASVSETEAERELARAEKLRAEGVASPVDVANWTTKLGTARAEAANAKAALGLAALNLREAYVRAPIAGIIQTRTVQTGQFIQPGAVLATLVRRDPLLLRFKVAESEASMVQPGQTAYLKVRELAQEVASRISFVAQAADPATRMVTVIAEIDKPPEQLRPGSFAEVRLPIASNDSALVIPQLAIRPSERGFLAFVVEDGVAKERRLTLGMRTPDDRVEVRQGLAAGETLVVRGNEALREDARIRVQSAPAGPKAAASGSSAAKDRQL